MCHLPAPSASGQGEGGMVLHDLEGLTLWRQVSNLPESHGKLETCRHKKLQSPRPAVGWDGDPVRETTGSVAYPTGPETSGGVLFSTAKMSSHHAAAASKFASPQ